MHMHGMKRARSALTRMRKVATPRFCVLSSSTHACAV